MEDKKYRYNVYLMAEEYSTGYVELTKKEAEIVEYATNTSNWKDKEIEPYSGFFGIDTDKAKNYVEEYLSKIPVQILKAFDSENWKIIITNEELKEKFGFTYEIYGVTDYDTKTIYTYASEDAIQYGLGHEIGHFVDMYMGDLSQTLEWNKLVKTINPQYTPAYYFTLGNNENKGLEYFADSFLLYINDKLLLTKCSLEVSKFWDRLFDYLDDILKVISENTIKTNIFTSPPNYWNLSD